MMIMTISYNNSSKKLSRVLDVLGGILKKGKSSEFNSRHDGGISGWPTLKTQKTMAAATRIDYFSNFTKTES